MERMILHVDMDAFFASVEELSCPALRGKPVMVCGNPNGRSVVAAASYPAREFGVSSGMPVTTARALCPNGIFTPGDPQKYIFTSLRVRKICEEFTPIVEPFSIDEFFLDVTGTAERFGGAFDLADRLKEKIRRVTSLNCTVGIGPNKVLSKTASSLNKPDGIGVLRKKDIAEKLHTLPLEKLFGIGEKTKAKLNLLGLEKIGDLARTEPETLEKIFGVVGEMLCRAARGEDDSPVIDEEHQPREKSIGNEYTLARDTWQRKQLERVLLGLSAKVGRRVRKAGYRARTITVKIRFGDFETITRARTMPQGISLDQEIFGEARKILRAVKMRQSVRLLGVSASNLTTTRERQMELFGIPCQKKLEKATDSIDRVRDRFGEFAITWGSLVKEGTI